MAAREAEQALAFDRAARLYRQLLELLDPGASERGALMPRLAQALANAGRSAESAAVYLAAPASSAAVALDFKQKAAQHLLFGGHIDEGLTVIGDVLASIGMSLPETRWQTILSVVVGRARVRMRGLRYGERETSAIAADELMTVDACWSVSAGLALVDTVRGAVFQTRHLLLALRSGEAERGRQAWTRLDETWPALAHSLLLQVQLTRICMIDLRGRAAIAAVQETPQPSERERLLRIALDCAAKIEGEGAEWSAPFALMIRAGVHVCRGQDEAALRLLDRAEEALAGLDMLLHAAVVRRRRGQLIGGENGAELIARSEAWMTGQEIRDPEAMSELFAPWGARPA
jgi:hypothetical protein